MIVLKLQVSILLCGLALLSFCLVNGLYTAEDVDEYAKLCNASKEDIDTIKNYNVPSTETGKSFIRCISDNHGLLDPNGKYTKVNTTKMMKKYFSEMPLNLMDEVNDICYIETSKITPSEWGTDVYNYKMWICWNTQFKANGIMPIISV